GARHQVAQERAAGITDVGCQHAREPPAQVILRQQDMMLPPTTRAQGALAIPKPPGLMASEPEQLGGGGAGIGHTAGDRPKALASDPAVDQSCLGSAAQVRPEVAGTGWLAIGIE